MAKTLTLAEGEKALGIDPDDLDNSLMEHADIYYHIADAAVLAAARRDQCKTRLEIATAELDDQLRKAAQAKEEKITEALLEKRLRLQPRIQELTQEHLDLKVEADRWTALKDAFVQRSFMLRELVARQIAQLQHLGLQRGMQSSRTDYARAEEARQERARDEPIQRYRRA